MPGLPLYTEGVGYMSHASHMTGYTHTPCASPPTLTEWSGKLSLRCCMSRKVSFQLSVSSRLGRLEEWVT